MFTLPGVGRRSRTVKARREAVAEAAGSVADEGASGRSQAYRDAYERARERARARLERPRGPWQKRGARIVRAAVSDEEWAQLARLAAESEQPASVYLGQLIRDHLGDGA